MSTSAHHLINRSIHPISFHADAEPRRLLSRGLLEPAEVSKPAHKPPSLHARQAHRRLAWPCHTADRPTKWTVAPQHQPQQSPFFLTRDPGRTAREIFLRWAVEGSCGDLLFSGHTTHGMILTLIIVRYAPGLRAAQALAVGLMVLLALALLAFRSHYTSDVVVAVYVVLMIWRLMPPEPALLDGDALRIEQHGGAGGGGGTGSNCHAAALVPEGSVAVVFADARESLEAEEEEGGPRGGIAAR